MFSCNLGLSTQEPPFSLTKPNPLSKKIDRLKTIVNRFIFLNRISKNQRLATELRNDRGIKIISAKRVKNADQIFSLWKHRIKNYAEDPDLCFTDPDKFRKYYGRKLETESMVKELHNSFTKKTLPLIRNFYALDEKDQVLGAMSISLLKEELTIEFLSSTNAHQVEPKHTGAGTALIAKAVRTALIHDLPRIKLQSSKNANTFYLQLGFQLIGRNEGSNIWQLSKDQFPEFLKRTNPKTL